MAYLSYDTIHKEKENMLPNTKKIRLSKLFLASALILPSLTSTAYAQEFTVTIKNLTNGSHFTPY
jgi:hypothetical protein